MLGGDDVLKNCRKTDIMSDAAYVVLSRDSKSRTGEFLIDEEVLREVGVTDFEQYACVPGKVSEVSHKRSAFEILEISLRKKLWRHKIVDL